MRSLHPALGPLLVLSLLGAIGCGPDESTTAAATGGDEGGGGGTSSAGGGSSSDGGSSSSSPTVAASTGSATTATSSSGEGGGGAGTPCTEGTILCNGTSKQVCDGEGGFTDEEDCSPGVCVAGVGCTLCAPGSGTCEGNVSTVCNADGSGFDTYVCDPEQGVTCNAQTGHCSGECAPQQLGSSYIGCDYFPTVTLNSELQNRPGNIFQAPTGQGSFAVAVANTSDDPTNVQVHRGATLVTTVAVPGGSVQIIVLPWVNELKNGLSSQVLADGAYRLRSNRPVTVYQYNPLEYTTANGNTYTNDASLLLPTNAWTGTYRVAARNSFGPWSGFYTVVAAQDGTTVTLTPSATGGTVIAGGGVAASGTGTVVLNEGDVLQVLSFTDEDTGQPYDVTGTLVSADKPVQVFGGHDCVYIPENTGYCDHLEESMPPVETLSTEYVVTPPQSAGGGADQQLVRVIATQDATTLTYDPPQAGAPGSIASAGGYIEIAFSSADYAITADKPILVSQYMKGQGDSGVAGDPAMALAVATEQYRDEYLFHAPTNYLSNYVNITAPSAATVTLDGNPVGGFTVIGASGYSVARVQLDDGGDGNHVVTGTMPFGISVYGYGDDTSYWYPGGLDLDKVDTN